MAADPERSCVCPVRAWIEGTPSLHEITDDVARPLEARPGAGWLDLLRASPSRRC